MDTRAKIAIAGIAGVVVGVMLLGSAVALPAVLGHMGRTVAFGRGADFGPGVMMNGRQGIGAYGPQGEGACPGGAPGRRGPGFDGQPPYPGRGPGMMQGPGARGFEPPCGGDPEDCPRFAPSAPATGSAS